jgi:uncharacterized protein
MAMTIFIDTSALLAVLDADDMNHPAARTAWEHLVTQGASLVCTNYNLVEVSALVQHRLGMKAVRTLQENIVPVLAVEWVDPGIHAGGMSALLVAGRRNLSLVDCVSFETMRRLGLDTAFAFDRHFAEQGFATIP